MPVMVEQAIKLYVVRIPLDFLWEQVIYTDPPWQLEFSGMESRATENHYPTKSCRNLGIL
jgi:hypothetical protein